MKPAKKCMDCGDPIIGTNKTNSGRCPDPPPPPPHPGLWEGSIAIHGVA